MGRSCCMWRPTPPPAALSRRCATATGSGSAWRNAASTCSSTTRSRGLGAGSSGERAGGTMDMTTCPKGSVWDRKKHSCLHIRGGVLPDDELTDYAYALAKADRYQEALDTLDLLQNPETP